MSDRYKATSEFFESLTTIRRIDEMIGGGEAEGLYLECKAPTDPRLSRDQKINLARAVSGNVGTGLNLSPHSQKQAIQKPAPY